MSQHMHGRGLYRERFAPKVSGKMWCRKPCEAQENKHDRTRTQRKCNGSALSSVNSSLCNFTGSTQPGEASSLDRLYHGYM